MAVTTYRSPQYSHSSSTETNKPSLWDKEFMIPNLPGWIYSDNKPPETVKTCKAQISSTEFTIKDIDLQLEIRDMEMKTGKSRHNSSFECDQWKTGALKAKQTHMYLLNAYKFWLIKNTSEETDVNNKLTALIKLLVEDPTDFCEKAKLLLY